MNMYRVRVRKWCASCQHKVVDDEGKRICQPMQLKVEQKFICKKWEMGEGLQNAGKSGGVVRLKGTTEVIIK